MCTTCGCSTHHHAHPDEDTHLQHHHHDNGDGHAVEETVRLEADILGENNKYAMFNRGFLAARHVKAFNMVSSPGSGKTTLLEATIKAIDNRRSIAVIEGDQQTDNDARRIGALGVDAVQINTANGCHLDAHMVGHAIEDLGIKENSLLFIENVGNLVCPAMFDLGETERVVVISVTEGDDKPLKYPLMFSICDVVIINKIDVLPYFDFDVEKCKEYIKRRNPNAKVFMICAKTGEGVDEWANWLLSEVKNWRDEK